jgi:YafQ family addiction module toxin component
MRKFDIEKKLHQILKKLFKKDKKRYEIIWTKIREVASSGDVEHYKNLRAPLYEFKRCHIDKSFILVFKYDKKKDKVIFYDFNHHDKIYLKSL